MESHERLVTPMKEAAYLTDTLRSSIQEAAMAEVRDEITEAYKAFEENFFKGDADALSLIYTDDAEWLVPEAPPIKGRAAIAQAWKGVIGPGGNRVRVEVRE